MSKVGGAYLLAKGNQDGIAMLVQLLSASPDQVVLQVERKWESLDGYWLLGAVASRPWEPDAAKSARSPFRLKRPVAASGQGS